MKLTVDLTALWKAVDNMGARHQAIVLENIWSSEEIEFERELSSGGVEISLQDLDVQQGLLSVKGRQVVLFIPDHSGRRDLEEVVRTPGIGNKFHIADCRTLEEMRQRNRFERYKVTNNMSGNFPVFGKSPHSGSSTIAGEAELNVCKNCLMFLNYKAADVKNSSHRRDLVNDFSLMEFFSTYSSLFKFAPKQHINEAKFGYSKDWKEVSLHVRTQSRFICQSCDLDLSTNKSLLHVHHINGEKSDNLDTNLIALCADCHRKEPYHGHMMVSRSNMEKITQLRTEQRRHAIDDWDSVMKLADPALSGILEYCIRNNMQAPVVGYEAIHPNEKTVTTLDLAWPRTRQAVSLDSSTECNGWIVFNLREAIANFKI